MHERALVIFLFPQDNKTKASNFNTTKWGSIHSHILKSKIGKSNLQRTHTHSVNRRLLNATPAFRYQSTLILVVLSYIFIHYFPKMIKITSKLLSLILVHLASFQDPFVLVIMRHQTGTERPVILLISHATHLKNALKCLNSAGASNRQ